jgi:hypothetical protein
MPGATYAHEYGPCEYQGVAYSVLSACPGNVFLLPWKKEEGRVAMIIYVVRFTVCLFEVFDEFDKGNTSRW